METIESVFTSKEHYAQFIKEWKQITNDSEERKELTLQHFILYRILRGKDWRSCLSPSSSDSTIADAEYYALESKSPSLWPFSNSVTKEMIFEARSKGLKKWSEE